MMPVTTDSGNTTSRIAMAENRAQLLRALANARADRDALYRNEADLIAWARDMGATWAEVGEALGISAKGARQAAQRRVTR